MHHAMRKLTVIARRTSAGRLYRKTTGCSAIDKLLSMTGQPFHIYLHTKQFFDAVSDEKLSVIRLINRVLIQKILHQRKKIFTGLIRFFLFPVAGSDIKGER